MQSFAQGTISQISYSHLDDYFEVVLEGEVFVAVDMVNRLGLAAAQASRQGVKVYAESGLVQRFERVSEFATARQSADDSQGLGDVCILGIATQTRPTGKVVFEVFVSDGMQYQTYSQTVQALCQFAYITRRRLQLRIDSEGLLIAGLVLNDRTMPCDTLSGD